jgi:hypothetical protein
MTHDVAVLLTTQGRQVSGRLKEEIRDDGTKALISQAKLSPAKEHLRSAHPSWSRSSHWSRRLPRSLHEAARSPGVGRMLADSRLLRGIRLIQQTNTDMMRRLRNIQDLRQRFFGHLS